MGTTDGTVLPDLLDGHIINRIAQLDQEDPRELPLVEPVREGLESIERLPDRVGDPCYLPPDRHLHILRQEPQHSLLPKSSCQLPHGGRVGQRLTGALLRGPVGQKDHGADDFIAPLRAVRHLEL
jgi:hypothetical protein